MLTFIFFYNFVNFVTGNIESLNSVLEKRKKPRRKPRSRLMEAFPPYMQEAFFGRDLLDTPCGRMVGEPDTSIPLTDSDSEEVVDATLVTGTTTSSTICLNQVSLILTLHCFKLRHKIHFVPNIFVCLFTRDNCIFPGRVAGYRGSV